MARRFLQVMGWLTLPVIVGCSPAAAPLPQRIVDRSPTISEDLPVRIWGQKLIKDFGLRETTRFEYTEIEQPVYVQNSYFELFNHDGAHLDAPRYLARDGQGVDGYDLTQLLGRARVLDFRQAPPGVSRTPSASTSWWRPKRQGTKPSRRRIGRFLPRGIPVFEELENLDQLPAETNVVFVGCPLKIRNGDASPVRAAALSY